MKDAGERERESCNKIPYNVLNMRALGNMRKDTVVKIELYDAHVKGKFS